jgi:hypothetical protein
MVSQINIDDVLFIKGDRMTRNEIRTQAVKKVRTRFEKYDEDRNGSLSQEEAVKAQTVIDLENKDKKEDQLRRMAWIAMLSMLICTVVIFLPFIPEARIEVIEAIIQTFYIAQAGVVATFFGANAYMTRASQDSYGYGTGPTAAPTYVN